MSLFARRVLVILCVLLPIFGAGALAQTQNPPETKEDVKLVVSAEGILTLDFADGREAQVLTAVTNHRSVPIILNMTENMCSPEYGRPSCRLISRVGLQRSSLVWTKHSDATKLGKMVGFSGSTFSTDRVFEEVMNNIEDNGAKDIFICDDYRWMNGTDTNEIHRNELILSWGSEGNFENSETKVNENMTISGAFNLELTGVFGRMYRIRGAQYIILFEGGLPLVSSGPATLAIRHKPSQDICQVQFSPDISKAIKISSELYIEIEKAPLKKLATTGSSIARQSYNIMFFIDMAGTFK